MLFSLSQSSSVKLLKFYSPNDPTNKPLLELKQQMPCNLTISEIKQLFRSYFKESNWLLDLLATFLFYFQKYFLTNRLLLQNSKYSKLCYSQMCSIKNIQDENFLLNFFIDIQKTIRDSTHQALFCWESAAQIKDGFKWLLSFIEKKKNLINFQFYNFHQEKHFGLPGQQSNKCKQKRSGIIVRQVFWLIINNMNNLIIREGRLLLQQPIQKQQVLTLKLCIGTNIYKFQNLIWNSFCRRWETTQEIKVNWSQEASIQLELYYHNNGFLNVLGEGIIDMAIFSGYLNQEIKIALTYDGIITGWLYCVLALEGQVQKQAENKFLCIYKISFFFLEEEDQNFKVEIFQNTLPIFEKQFTVIQRGKTIFPNLKKPIHYSDVISLSINHSKKQFKTVSFLVDNIKRGKTTFFQSWIRNNHNNKTGDMRLEYFLQNLFLQNDRKLVSRKGIYNATSSGEESILKMSDTQNFEEASTKPESKEYLLHQKSYQEKGSEKGKLIRTKKMHQRQKPKLSKQLQIKRTPVNHFSQQIKKSQNALPCLRQTKTNFIASNTKLSQKGMQKKQFYFQNPLQQ